MAIYQNELYAKDTYYVTNIFRNVEKASVLLKLNFKWVCCLYKVSVYQHPEVMLDLETSLIKGEFPRELKQTSNFIGINLNILIPSQSSYVQ